MDHRIEEIEEETTEEFSMMRFAAIVTVTVNVCIISTIVFVVIFVNKDTFHFLKPNMGAYGQLIYNERRPLAFETTTLRSQKHSVRLPHRILPHEEMPQTVEPAVHRVASFRVRKLSTFYSAERACAEEEPNSKIMTFNSLKEENLFMNDVNPSWFFDLVCPDFFLGYKLSPNKMWSSRDRQRFISTDTSFEMFVGSRRISYDMACLTLHPDVRFKVNNVPCTYNSSYYMCEEVAEGSKQLLYHLVISDVALNFEQANSLCFATYPDGRLALPRNRNVMYEMWRSVPFSLHGSERQILIGWYYLISHFKRCFQPRF